MINENMIQGEPNATSSIRGIVELATNTETVTGTDTEKATTPAGVAAAIAAIPDPLLYKGVIDCSGSPNYPAADAGHTYIVSVAGKIGGASGIVVSAGDMLLCKTDSSSAGTQAVVGANWDILEKNLVQASTTEQGYVELATDAETIAGIDTERAVTSSNITAKIDIDGTLAGNLDTRIPSQKAVKTYADTKIPSTQKGAASGVASLNGSTKVVEDPANATVTPTASKIPISDGSGKLDGWISSASGSTPGLLTPASPTESGGTTPNIVHDRKPVKIVSTTPVTLTLPEIANGLILVNTGASVIVLPSADATYDGASVKFRSIAAVSFSVDNTAQITEFNGTALDAGDKVTSSGVAREEITFTWDNTSSRWRTSDITGVFIDGGA
jgi:hypothetical protein